MKRIGVLFLVLICIVTTSNICNACPHDWAELPERFESDEFIFRETSPEDALILSDCLLDPSMTQYLDLIPMTFKTRDDVLKVFMKRDDRGEVINKEDLMITYTICLKASEEPIGQIMICKENADSSFINLGFWISKQQKGNKYALKAAKVFIDKLFECNDSSKVSVLVLTCHIQNIASQKTIERLGFQRCAEYVFKLKVEPKTVDIAKINLYNVDEKLITSIELPANTLPENIKNLGKDENFELKLSVNTISNDTK